MDNLTDAEHLILTLICAHEEATKDASGVPESAIWDLLAGLGKSKGSIAHYFISMQEGHLSSLVGYYGRGWVLTARGRAFIKERGPIPLEYNSNRNPVYDLTLRRDGGGR